MSQKSTAAHIKRVTYPVMLCVNNPDNGMPTRYIHSMEILDAAMYACRPIRWSHTKGRLNIGRLRVPIVGWVEWVGNWCWNCATVNGPTAGRILRWMLAHRDDWGCEQGPAGIFNAMNAKATASL